MLLLLGYVDVVVVVFDLVGGVVVVAGYIDVAVNVDVDDVDVSVVIVRSVVVVGVVFTFTVALSLLLWCGCCCVMLLIVVLALLSYACCVYCCVVVASCGSGVDVYDVGYVDIVVVVVDVITGVLVYCGSCGVVVYADAVVVHRGCVCGGVADGGDVAVVYGGGVIVIVMLFVLLC